MVKLNKPNIEPPPIFNTNRLERKNKKKKKNLYAGLKKSAILSISTSSIEKSNNNKVAKFNLENNNNQNHKNVFDPPNQSIENINTNNIDFIPLDMPSTSIVVTKSLSSDNRNVAVVTKTNNVNFKQAKGGRYFSADNQINKNASNKNNSLKNKKNKFKSGKVKKNEVLRKTESKTKKNNKNIKGLANILNKKETTSSTLANFLKNL